MRKEMIQSMTLDKSVSIPHNWERLAERAMATTEVSSCKGWRWWWRISAHRASSLLRPSFDWMACMATEPLSRI
jgi:hypothetical protein